MKNNCKNRILAASVVVLLAVLFLSSCNKKPQDPLVAVKERKYADSPSYTIEKQSTRGPWTVFLGRDEKNLYLDIYEGKGHFGGSEIALDDPRILGEYNFRQDQTLTIIYGINDKFAGYEMTVQGDYPVPMEFKKDLTDEKYILDVYVLDKEGEFPPEVTFIRK